MAMTLSEYKANRRRLFKLIAKARKEHREGKTIVLKTPEDIDRYFDSL